MKVLSNGVSQITKEAEPLAQDIYLPSQPIFVRNRGRISGVAIGKNENYAAVLEDTLGPTNGEGLLQTEAMLLKANDSQGIFFEIIPAHQESNLKNSVFVVEPCINDPSPDYNDWRLLGIEPEDQLPYDSIDLPLEPGVGYLAGMLDAQVRELTPQAHPLENSPYVVQIDGNRDQQILFWVDTNSQWQSLVLDRVPQSLIENAKAVASTDQQMIDLLTSAIHEKRLDISLTEIVFRQQPEAVGKHEPIHDPLEGAISGETRSERYANFMHEVLGAIWPQANGSGEYADDFWRATRFNLGELSGYTHFSPNSLDPLLLTPDEFETAVANLATADYLRVRSIPPQLLNPEASIIPVGGSCAIETWGLRIIADLKAGIENGSVESELLSEVARAMLEMAPSISHISGAVLSGQEATVHLVESDMWAERVAGYGIPREEADRLVSAAYERISEAIARRAKLINPNTEVVNVNFDLLDLPATLMRWFDGLGIPYDPSHRVFEVVETYIGPEQLNILKQTLEEILDRQDLKPRQRQAVISLLRGNLHMRGKQIDHGRWGSMNLPKEVIIDRRELIPQELEKHQDDYAFMTGLALFNDVYRRHTQQQPTSVVTLFADLPGPGNTVQHQDRKMGLTFKGRPGEEQFLESVQKALENPRRLHRGNISEHLQLLETYTLDLSGEREQLIDQKKSFDNASKQLKEQLSHLKNQRKSQMAKSERLGSGIQDNQAVSSLIAYVHASEEAAPDKSMLQAAIRIRERLTKTLASIQSKSGDLSSKDEQDLAELPQIISFLSEVEAGGKPALNQTIERRLGEIEMEAHKQISQLEKNLERTSAELSQTDVQISQLETELEPFDQQASSLENRIKSLKIKHSPLSDHPFVHHAMQFLWDSDFVTFLKEAVAIQQARRENGESYRKEADLQMIALCAKIYPKLKAYINYLYGRHKYPQELREQTLLDQS